MRYHHAFAFIMSRLSALSAAILGLALLVLCTSAPARADGMAFEEVNYGGENVISATGRITDETPNAFLRFLREHPGSARHAVVFLDSPGGIVLASMQLGTILRKIGAAAVVGRVSNGLFAGQHLTGGACLSACVYTLIGARKRVIPPESEVGIHRMFLTVEDNDVTSSATKHELDIARGLRNMLSSYAGRMGVSPEIITRAENTPSEDLHMLTRKEIKKWRLGVPNL